MSEDLEKDPDAYKNELIVGIDLGTTKSAVSWWDPDLGRARILEDAKGKTIMPSVVAWDRDYGKWLVGHAAKAMSAEHPGDVVYSIKRCIGRWYKDPNVQKALLELTYKLVSGGRGKKLQDVVVDFGPAPDSPSPHLVSAPEISAQVLAKLRDTAVYDLKPQSGKVEYAVITVPAYFDTLQRSATRLAGELAHLEVVDILNEPTAAALAYGAAYGDEVIGPDPRKILVYDLGGGTFDISILEARRLGLGYEITTLGVDGHTRLGGDDIDSSVVKWLEDTIEQRYHQRVRADDHGSRARLRLAAEQAKIDLSSAEVVTLEFEQLDLGYGHPRDIEIELTREQLEARAAGVLKRTKEITKHAVRRVEGLTWDQIDQVILVGGQTLMPAVQRAVTEVTGGKEPRVLDWPQEAVARGAGEYAHIKSLGFEGFKEHILSHVTALPLGILVGENTFKPIVEANVEIPHDSKAEIVTTDEDQQPFIDVYVLQKPRGAETADQCTELGHLRMEVPPAPRGVPSIAVEFNVLWDGTMKVHVRDVHRNREETLDIIEDKTTTWR